MAEGRPHWQTTAPPAPACPRLDGAGRTEVVVVGGGFTGLTTALHLAVGNVEVTLLEAGELGAQASGRTNGQVIPTLKKEDPHALLAHFGEPWGERMILMMRDAANALFRLIEEHKIDCDAEQAGWLQPAHSARHMAVVEQRQRQWEEYGAKTTLLDRQAMAAKLGSEFYCGGWQAHSGGHIQPLSLVRGLARAAIAHGARIHTQSRVTGIDRNGGEWRVETSGGQLRAAQIVIATNGATPAGLLEPLARTTLPATFYQLATEPLTPAQQRLVLPGRQAMSDMQGDIRAIRYDRENRLITGATLIFERNWRRRLDSIVDRRFRALFPGLGKLSYADHWSGEVGMTPDFFPRLFAPAPGIWAWTGCNGRGISLSTRMGAVLAEAVCGKAPAELPLPISPAKGIGLHSILGRLLPFALSYERATDWFAHKYR